MASKKQKTSGGSEVVESRQKISRILPLGLKKILIKSRGAALVLFEEIDHGRWPEMFKENELLIAARSDNQKKFTINLAENPLDVYRSPHLLDLSKIHRFNNLSRYQPEPEMSYRDLPGGAWLDKFGLFDFWDFNKSEIVICLKQAFQTAIRQIKMIFAEPDISYKPVAESAQPNKPESVIEQISLFKLVLFFSDFYYKIYLLLRGVAIIWLLLLKNLFKQDETVWLDGFNNHKIATDEPQQSGSAGVFDKIIALNSSPTIAELLNAPGSQINQEKFKIISSVSKKQAKDKYLQDNFNRRGVVPNVQPPSAPWPKDSLSWDLGNLVFSPATLKPVAIFCGILIALTCSVKAMSYWEDISRAKGMVLGEAEQAIGNISSAEAGIKSMDFQAAREKFVAAQANFTSAQQQLNEIKSFITVLAEVAPAENTYKSGTNLIEMGEHLSNAANHLLAGVNAASGDSDLSLSNRIKNLSLELDPALTELEAANINAEKIGLSHLPEEHKNKFIKLKSSLPAAIEALRQLKESSVFAVKVLGDNDLKRYLLVFQNDNELRATGGFMGSFALIDFKMGAIEKITIPQGGTYDVRAGFNELVAPPQPMQIITDKWEFQDSNWWPDFPTSAQNIKWFYEKSGGPTVDGVIAINSSFLGKLLELTGSVDLPQYGKVINSANFENELQKSIELEATEKNKPKKILGELAPILLDRLLKLPPKQIFDLTKILSDGLASRDIQMYFSASDLQNFANKNNWSGALEGDQGADFLSVVSTNIGGGKTDSVIKQKIYHQAEIQNDGSIIDRVLIARENFGPTDEFFTKIANNSYIRVYVPAGSQLVQAAGFKGFDENKFKKIDEKLKYKDELASENSAAIDLTSGTRIYNENGKTVFANWSIAGPGESRDLLLVYKLPFKVNISSSKNNIVRAAANFFSPEISAYSLKFQKQSGRSQDEFTPLVSYPANLSPKFSFPETAEAGNRQINFGNNKTNADKYFVIGFTDNLNIK